jgi:hypothetical protein
MRTPFTVRKPIKKLIEIIIQKLKSDHK